MLAACWGNLFFHTGFEQWAIYWKPDRKASARLKTNRAPHLANGDAVWEVWVKKKGLVCASVTCLHCQIPRDRVTVKLSGVCLSPQVGSRNQTWLALWNSKVSTLNWKNWLLESCLKEFPMEFKEETWELSAGKLHLSSRHVCRQSFTTLIWDIEKTYFAAFAHLRTWKLRNFWMAGLCTTALQRIMWPGNHSILFHGEMSVCQNPLLATFHPASLQR